MKRGLLLFLMLLFMILSGCAGGARSSSSAIPGSTNSLYISAWYATYDAERGLQSFSNNIRLFNEINPVWYNLNPAYFTGGAPPFVTDLRNKPTILSLARANGVKVLPTIQNFGATNFDATVINAIINDPVARRKHVQEIVNLVLTENYDGIDLDYENLPASVKDAFSAFVTELSAALHQYRKLLSVTVYSKTSVNATWAGPGAQDWPVLVNVVDTLKIMAYDYHWVTSDPGPISPLNWLQNILNYAKTVPGAAGKLIIGLPFYGLDWGYPAREVMYQDVMGILNQYSYSNYSRQPVEQLNNVELNFIYTKNGTNRTVYFQDHLALRERLKVINQYRDLVKGVTFWHLGGEDPNNWNELKSYK